jgi:hypothetical protein
MRLHDTLSGFSPISLAELNAKAEMLARLDNKYITGLDKLDVAILALRDGFDVLDIGGTRSFAYRTCYYDDAERRAYYDHHQRRRKRCKVRIRSYLDAGLDYLEVKVIEPRATTAKFRHRLEGSTVSLDGTGLAFVDKCHREAYGTPFGKQVSPVLVVEYERITLVARAGGERLTVDIRLKLSGAGRCRQPTARVSKFCIGMVSTGQVRVRNGFLPALRKLGLADEVFPLPAVLQEQPVPANDRIRAGRRASRITVARPAPAERDFHLAQ